MIQKTSLDAYMQIIPDLSNRQKIVYDKLITHPSSCNRDLAKLLFWEINQVTPRIKELRDLNLVICCGYKVDEDTKKNVMVWKVR